MAATVLWTCVGPFVELAVWHPRHNALSAIVHHSRGCIKIHYSHRFDLIAGFQPLKGKTRYRFIHFSVVCTDTQLRKRKQLSGPITNQLTWALNHPAKRSSLCKSVSHAQLAHLRPSTQRSTIWKASWNRTPEQARFCWPKGKELILLPDPQ